MADSTPTKTIRVHISGYAGVGKTTLAAVLLRHLSSKFCTTKVMDPEGDTALKAIWIAEGKIVPEELFKDVTLEIHEVYAQRPLAAPSEPLFTLAEIKDAYETISKLGETSDHYGRFIATLEHSRKESGLA